MRRTNLKCKKSEFSDRLKIAGLAALLFVLVVLIRDDPPPPAGDADDPADAPWDPFQAFSEQEVATVPSDGPPDGAAPAGAPGPASDHDDRPSP